MRWSGRGGGASQGDREGAARVVGGKSAKQALLEKKKKGWEQADVSNASHT